MFWGCWIWTCCACGSRTGASDSKAISEHLDSCLRADADLFSHLIWEAVCAIILTSDYWASVCQEGGIVSVFLLFVAGDCLCCLTYHLLLTSCAISFPGGSESCGDPTACLPIGTQGFSVWGTWETRKKQWGKDLSQLVGSHQKRCEQCFSPVPQHLLPSSLWEGRKHNPRSVFTRVKWELQQHGMGQSDLGLVITSGQKWHLNCFAYSRGWPCHEDSIVAWGFREGFHQQWDQAGVSVTQQGLDTSLCPLLGHHGLHDVIILFGVNRKSASFFQ